MGWDACPKLSLQPNCGGFYCAVLYVTCTQAEADAWCHASERQTATSCSLQQILKPSQLCCHTLKLQWHQAAVLLACS